MSKTISTTYSTGVTLSSASYDPTTITSTGLLPQGLSVTYDGAWRVLNQGTIQGSSAYGIYLRDGGTVTNQAGGYIGGGRGGIAAPDGVLTVVNDGGIYSTNSFAIHPLGGGSVTNQAGGTIRGKEGGIEGTGATMTVVNAGGITGTNGDGINLQAGGGVTNQAGGTIIGYSGINAASALAVVVNYGSIAETGRSIAAINFAAAGSVTNQSTGTISGHDGISGSGHSLLTVTNAGVITAMVWGINLSSGSITNQMGGTITGAIGVYATGLTTVINAGDITASSGYGIFLKAGGSVTNQANATITGYTGLRALNGPATVVNHGDITAHGAGGYAVILIDGGSVTNQSGGTISGGLGVLGQAAAMTVVNAGTITGTDYALVFAAGYTNRLTVDPGAVFAGRVSGGDTASSTTAISTLELTSATTSGKLSGLGIQFTGFIQTTIDTGASWTLTGANALATGTTVTNAGTLTLQNATLTDSGDFVNNGVILIDPSNITLADLTGTGTDIIEADSTLNVLGTVATGQTIVFSGTSHLLGANPTAFAGQIDGFTFGDTIQLAGVLDGTSAEIVNGNTLQVDRSGNPPVDLTLDPSVSYAGDFYTVSPTGAVTETEIPCFLAGTLIRTATAEVAVQDLTVGDHVLTLSGQARPITWIGTGTVLVSPGKRSAATPVIVRKGALADNVPHHDLRITKGHALFIDDVMVPVEFLINHRSILWDDHQRTVTFHHIELENHAVLVANGAPSESYRDDGNRWLFQNANSGWDQPPKPPYAPVLTGGPAVDAIWQRLLDRSGPRPGVAMTDDPDLHLLVRGRRLDAMSRSGGFHVFRLVGPPDGARVVSRSGAPQELGLARDPRSLGVALLRIVIRQGRRSRVIEADDGLLVEGFHAFEADNGFRWTDGDADLPALLFAGFEGPLELVLHCAATTQYVEDGAKRRVA
jgi:hypothetical protein